MRLNIFKRTILWNALYYAINTFTLFYIDAKGKLQGAEGFLFIIPIFIISFSTEIWVKHYKRNKFYRYGIFDTTSKLISMLCALLIYMQVANEVWYWVCLVLYFICMVSSVIFTIILLRYEKTYMYLIDKKMMTKILSEVVESGNKYYFPL